MPVTVAIEYAAYRILNVVTLRFQV